ncbi:AraC-type DNA-binding protein [Fodinibius salinus]|uniref:AraC-type DNA-binding protein n=1 Tax=Fodinibius salinus TaxID=860790 RepID=A0A5D3YM06_9BACT|nr:helix-turn-helix transcriptional regulator [Fodinibius salinus]TYP94802.1 AraC-type DNA-binding protein [Fodinibius salinus]
MSSYQELVPDKALQNIVDCYWISDTDSEQSLRILPDGCTDLIFNFGSTVSAVEEQAGLPEKSISAVGIMTKYQKVCVTPNTRLVGVRFKTGAMSPLTSVPLHKLKDTNIGAGNICPGLTDATWERMVGLKSQKQLSSALDQVIFRMKSKSDDSVDPIAIALTQYIRDRKGNITVKDLTNNFGISKRQLERRFRSTIGVNMKSYARIVRFLYTKSLIELKPQENLLNIAFDNGYYDHAHLTKDFKKMAGFLPSEI